MNKVLLLFFIIFSVFSQNVEAGLFSKAAKAYVAGQVVKKSAPIIAKKLAAKAAKKQLAKEALRKNKLKVDTYEKLVMNRPRAKKIGEQTEQLDAHHMPSNNYMKNKGVSKEDGIAIEMQPARHTQTRTYGNKNKDPELLKETPREALGRDIKDVKKVYQENGQYNANVRESLQEVAKKNKEQFPDLYKKWESYEKIHKS